MKIIIEQDEAQLVRRIAKQNGVNEEKLWEFYQEITENNFLEDLCDIARENETELKGE